MVRDYDCRKGTLQPIQIKTAQRAGKKVATLITNFEPFLIDPEALAESLRHSCASATSGTCLHYLSGRTGPLIMHASKCSGAERRRRYGSRGPGPGEAREDRNGPLARGGRAEEVD